MSLNYDVLAKIFESLEEPSPSGSRTSKRQLLWAALTCKFFQDSALDALWRTLDTVVPLLKLLHTIEKVNGVYTLCGDINNHDKRRFDFYAKKIRVLSFEDGEVGKIDPFVLTVLPLLPYLQKVICSSFDQLNAQNTLLFLSSTLREIVLFPDGSPPNMYASGPNNEFESMRRFIYALHKKAPHIHRFVLRRRIDSRLWDFILRFQSLYSLEISGVMDVITFRNIAALPQLQHLKVGMIDTSCLPKGFLNTDDDIWIKFLKLRSLQLSGEGSTIASYLLRMRGGYLSNISITMITTVSNDSQQPGHWETCIIAMEKQWALTLRHLRLECKCRQSGTYYGDSEHGLIQTSPQFFISLSNIALEHLVIEGQVVLSECHSLASAIRRIKTVFISRVNCRTPSHGEGDNHGSLPYFFESFAKYCPHLVSLSVGFDAIYSPSSPSSPSRYRHNQLKKLCIASEDLLDVNNLQHPIDVARHLNDQFPSLTVIDAKNKNTPRNAEFWRHVQRLVHEFQVVKQQALDNRRLKEGSSPVKRGRKNQIYA